MTTPDYFSRKPPYIRTNSRLTPNDRNDRLSASPRTPSFGRSLSSQYGSPGGSYRAEEEAIIYAVGARSFSAGFTGESAPRCIQTFGPNDSRRVDDFRQWTTGANRSLNRNPGPWGKEWELWSFDLRNLDLDLVEDKVERAVRQAHTKYLLLDQRSRRAVIALPTGLSSPLLEVVLRTMFKSSGPSSISIWANPLLCTVSAGLRSALVVDIGWEEVTVTAVYEYREVLHRRSIRAAKDLTMSTAEMLEEHTGPVGRREKIAFETAEDIMSRMAWCKRSKDAEDPDYDATATALPIRTASGLSTMLKVPFAALSDPAERTFFDSDSTQDDHTLPLHILAYRCLLALPLDVRAICMSRIIITGGVSNIPGLKPRLIREIEELVNSRGWDPVMNYGSATEARKKAAQTQTSTLSLPMRERPPDGASIADQSPTPIRAFHERDEISDKLAREAAKRGSPAQGVVRGVETLGVWAGASIIAGLKVEGMLEVRRDEFLKYGLASFGNRLDAM